MLKGVDGPATFHVIRSGIILAAILTPLQIFIGDLHGLNTLEHQPAKIAAIEAVWETERGAALTLIGFPDEEARTTHAAIKIPYLGSLILTHDIDGEIRGLNDFEGKHPPVSVLFWSFRVMVGIGVLMLIVSWWSLISITRTGSFSRFHLQILAAMTFSGWVAVLAGWFVTEIGRQPWIVYNLIRTSEVVAEHSAGMVLGTLLTYLALYVFLMVSYIGALLYLSSKPAARVEDLIRPDADKLEPG
jgi:cytochrome d ubiquinol oxidase subunit I